MKAFDEAVERLEYRLLPCVCGHGDGWTKRLTERCGFDITLMACERCGLVRQNPCPTDKFYEWLYSSPAYRALYGEGHAVLHANKTAWGRQNATVIAEMGLGKFGLVYDVGCGSGGVLVGMSSVFERGIGCDLGGDYLERTRQLGLPSNVELVCGSAHDLEQGAADLVIACHTIEHSTTLAETLLEHRALLKPSGLLMIEVPTIAQIRDVYGHDLKRYAQLPHVWCFTDRVLVPLLASVGFETVMTHHGVAFAKLATPRPWHPDIGEAPRVLAELHEYERCRLKPNFTKAWCGR